MSRNQREGCWYMRFQGKYYRAQTHITPTKLQRYFRRVGLTGSVWSTGTRSVKLRDYHVGYALVRGVKCRMHYGRYCIKRSATAAYQAAMSPKRRKGLGI